MKPLEEFTTIEATVTYKSGRIETFTGRIIASGQPEKRFLDKLEDLKKYPQVESVKTRKY